MTAKHFAGLDGLRFLSITFVVLHHLFTFKNGFGLNSYDYPVLGTIGLYGIHFFFMGSGFLITYLLLAEYKTQGAINLKYFFLRRILRIWPAYYLLILTALVVLLQMSFFRMPGSTDAYLSGDYQRSNLFYFFFLPHLQPFFHSTAPYVHHTYTIGIEEQFYFLWGILFAFFRKWALHFFVALVVAYPLLNFLHDYLHSNYPAGAAPLIGYIKSGITYLHYSRLSTFAIGSLFGWAYFHQSSWIHHFKKVWVQLLVYFVFAGSIATGVKIPFIQNEYMAVIMACIMLAATFKKECLVNYDRGWLKYLGQISYGIYLFHIIAIVLAAKITVLLFNTESSIGVLFFLMSLTMMLSIIFGYLSYTYFEAFFLKLKRGFRKVRVGHE